MMGMDGGLADVIDELMGMDPDGLDDESLHDAVVEAERLSSRLAAVRARLVSSWDSRCVWAGDRSRSAGARLARDAHCAPATARAEVRRARKLRSMPLTRAAFDAGKLSTDHVDTLCAANHEPVCELFARDEALLVEEGCRLRFDDFHRLVQHWRNIADDDAAEDCADRHHQDRYLKASPTLDGMIDLQGRLAPIDGAIVKGELDRLERQLFEADWATARAIHGPHATADHLPRTTAQRHADAIVEMARRSAAMPANAKQARILCTILVGYETFKGRVCELANGAVLTPGQVATTLTEADIERIVFDTPSRIIDIGARTRCFTGALRRAIEVRDRHCTHPGCTIPADQCHIDHIIEYATGGPTTQTNGRLLCAHHNHQRPGRTTPPHHGP